MSLKGLKCIVAAATAAMDGEAVESGARPVTIVWYHNGAGRDEPLL